MGKMDEERKAALQQSLLLEMHEQRAHDYELSQLHDDVLHHINASTDEIIADFENIHHSSDEDCFGISLVNEFNCDWYHEPHESSEDVSNDNDSDAPSANTGNKDGEKDDDSDDLNENTDTEDGAEDAVALIQANMNLLVFLKRQSATIARLRARTVM
jgi:hypothetical protein